MKEMIEALKKYALDNYNEGGHWVYETHDDRDYEGLIVATGSLEDAMKQIKEYWELKQDMDDDISATAW